MGAHVVGIYNGTEFTKAIPWIWNGSKWLLARPYVYSSGWKAIGGDAVLHPYFFDKNNSRVVDVNNNAFLVRDDGGGLTDKNGKQLITSDSLSLRVEEVEWYYG